MYFVVFVVEYWWIFICDSCSRMWCGCIFQIMNIFVLRTRYLIVENDLVCFFNTYGVYSIDVYSNVLRYTTKSLLRRLFTFAYFYAVSTLKKFALERVQKFCDLNKNYSLCVKKLCKKFSFNIHINLKLQRFRNLQS